MRSVSGYPAMQRHKFPWMFSVTTAVFIVVLLSVSAAGIHFSSKRPLYHLYYLVDESALFEIEAGLAEWIQATSFSYFLLDGGNVSASIANVLGKTNKAADSTLKIYVFWCDGLMTEQVRSSLDELYTDLGYGNPHYWYLINGKSDGSYKCPDRPKDENSSYVKQRKCCQSNLLCTPLWQQTHPYLPEVEIPCFPCSVTDSGHFTPLHNQHLRVGTAIWYPFVGYRKDRTPPYYGICIDLLEYIASKTGFTYTLVEPPDGYWGGKVNGSWTGLVGMLERKEVDIVVAPLSNIPQRHEVMKFVDQPFYIDHTTVMFMIEKYDNSPSSALFMPLNRDLWIAIPGVWILSAVVVWFVQCLEYRIRKDHVHRANVNLILWDFFSVFTMQGLANYSEYRHRPASKIILFCTRLCVVILTAAYAANLVAFLAVSTTKLPFSNVEEMLAQNRYKFGMMAGTSHELTFRNSTVPMFQKVWEQIESFARYDPSVLSRNYTEQLAKVNKEKYAWIAEETDMRIQSKDVDKCVLRSLANPFGLTDQYAVGLQKHSRWSALFIDIITEARTNGLIDYWTRKHLGRREIRCPKRPTKDIVKLHHVFYLFCGLFAALAVATVTLICENIALHFSLFLSQKLTPLLRKITL